MKVWFKRGLFALVALAIIALVGGAIFLLTFNPNSYKQKLADVVYQKYQRTLKIDGEIELSLFPRIGLSVQGLSLSDRNSADTFASLESARFAVALWPLISNRLVVDHVAVTGFKAWIVREEDGSFNFDDLWQAPPAGTDQAKGSAVNWLPAAHAAKAPEADEAVVAKQPTEQDESSSLTDRLAQRAVDDTDFQIDIAGLSLRKGEIHFYSKRSNTTARLLDLELNTGRVTFGQPFDVDMKAQLRGDYPSISAELNGQAQLKLEPSIQSYAAQRLDVRVNGRFDQLEAQSVSVKGNIAYNVLLRQFQATQLETNLQGQWLGVHPIQNLQASLSSPRFMIDQAGDLLSFEKLALRANGKTQEQALELAVDVPRMAVSASEASAEPLTATFKLTGPRVLGLALHLKGLTGNSEKLYFDDARLEAAFKRGTRVAQWKAASPAEWQPAGQWIKLHDIQSSLRVEDEASKGSRYNLPISGTADLNIGQSIYSSVLAVQTDEARSQLAFDLRPDAVGSLLTLGLDAESVNWDELQSIFVAAAPQLEAEKVAEPEQNAEQTDAAEAAATPPNAEPVVEEESASTQDPLSWLEQLRVKATLNIQALRAHGLRLSDVQAQLESDAKNLQLKSLRAQLYEGELQAKASLSREYKYQLDMDLQKVQLGSLLLDGWGNDYMYGLANVKLQLQTQGSTRAASLAALGGQLRLQVQEGGWRGIDLTQRVRDINEAIRNAFSGDVPALPSEAQWQERTVFKQLQSQVSFKQGQGTVKALQLDMPWLRVTQSKPASVDLLSGQLDMVLLLRLPASMNAEERKLWQSLRNVALPLSISGPLDALQYRIQWQEIKSTVIQKALSEGLLDLFEKQSPVELLQEEQQANAGMVGQQLGELLQANVPPDSKSLGQTIKNLLGQ